MREHKQILLANIHESESYRLAVYEGRGGYTAVRKALQITPDNLIALVKESGLRGRGGAGFPTGIKWGFVPRSTGKPIYLLQNADESEPGTFKDRLLLERDPHRCIEGMLIAAWALGSSWSCIYIRGEYAFPYTRINDAVKECYQKGYLGSDIFGSGFRHEMIVHRGAGAYICGEETGLIQSLEGKKGQPRNKPPFPAVAGLYNCPTVVNNTETLAALPWIVENGPEAYRRYGTERSPGTKLISACGHIKRPGVYEIEMGYPLLEFLANECGGVRGGRSLKAVIPGGCSVPVLRFDELEDVCLDYESLLSAGSMLGSGGFIVMDDSTDMVEMSLNLARFYAHESCGQCTPCREGSHWIEKILHRLINGRGLPGDMDLIGSISAQIGGHTICPFGDALVTPVRSFISKFPEDFKRCVNRPTTFQSGMRELNDREEEHV